MALNSQHTTLREKLILVGLYLSKYDSLGLKKLGFSCFAEAFHVIESANQKVYQSITLPQMGTGATDMSALRAKGMQCYGIGPILDEEDAPRGFGAHSDQERILEDGLYKFVQFNWEVATALAASKH